MITGFKEIQQKLAHYDSKREALIKKAREVLKSSKQLIYAVHRDNSAEAQKLLKIAKKTKKELDTIATFHPQLVFEGSYSDACQEYIEAMCYFEYVKNKKIPGYKSLKVSHEDYIMGLSDLTGELTRRAVSLTSKKAFKDVEKIKKTVEDIYGDFLKLDLPNGLMRKKFDAIKWNLKKLEEVIYDIQTR